jgi:hypothetical protein
MAKRIFHNTSWTPTATADTTNLANATYMAIQGGSATQLINVLEILIDGQATTSAPTFMQFARDSTVGVGFVALAAPAGDGPMHPSTAPLAAPPVTYTAVTAGTLAQRAAVTTQGKLELGLNAFGGIMKWNPYTPDMAWGILSATQPLGESSLSAFTGGTPQPISAHIIYEPL